jgi:hypothetical protein
MRGREYLVFQHPSSFEDRVLEPMRLCFAITTTRGMAWDASGEDTKVSVLLVLINCINI